MSKFKELSAKIQLISDLLDENVYDDEGNIIGKREPLITKEQALELLNIEENNE